MWWNYFPSPARFRSPPSPIGRGLIASSQGRVLAGVSDSHLGGTCDFRFVPESGRKSRTVIMAVPDLTRTFEPSHPSPEFATVRRTYKFIANAATPQTAIVAAMGTGVSL